MLAVEMPKKRPLPQQFTKENAAANAAKAIEARKSKPRLALTVNSHQDQYFAFKNHFTQQTQAMLHRCLVRFNKCRTSQADGVVIGNIERLFKIWCHLTGTPAPGNLRPSDLVKRVEKLGLKSFAQSVMIDAPAPVEDSAIEPLPEPLPELPPEPTTDDARATCQDVLDTKESLKSPEPDRGDGQGGEGAG